MVLLVKWNKKDIGIRNIGAFRCNIMDYSQVVFDCARIHIKLPKPIFALLQIVAMKSVSINKNYGPLFFCILP